MLDPNDLQHRHLRLGVLHDKNQRVIPASVDENVRVYEEVIGALVLAIREEHLAVASEVIFHGGKDLVGRGVAESERLDAAHDFR